MKKVIEKKYLNFNVCTAYKLNIYEKGLKTTHNYMYSKYRMIYANFKEHILKMKNHHIMLGVDEKSILKKIVDNTERWSLKSVLADDMITHFHLTPKWKTYLFSKLNKKWQHVIDSLGYSDVSKLPSAQDFLSKFVGDDEVTFFYQKEFKFGKMTKKNFLNLMKKNRFLSEWIRTDDPRRVYFDIDGKDKHRWVSLENFLEKVKEKLTIDGKPPRIAVSGSNGYKWDNGKFTEEKYESYHIVLPDFYFPDHISMMYFKQWVASIGGDNAIYMRNSKFKCINQKKKAQEGDDRIQKIITDDNAEHHIVQLLRSELENKINLATDEWNAKFKIEHINNVTTFVRQRSQARHSSGIHEIQPINTFDVPTLNINRESAIQILDKFQWKEGYRLPYQVWKNIVRWASKEGITYVEFVASKFNQEWLKYNPSEITTEAEYNKIFDVPVEKWRPASRYQIRDYLSKHYGCDLLPKYLTKFKNKFFKRDRPYKGIMPKIVKEKYVKLFNITDAKFHLICVSMGAGKTELAIRYLLKQHPDKSFCFITTRISQAEGVIGRTDEVELGVFLYSKAGCEKHIKLVKKDRLCVEIESLHHLFKRRYDILILDEFESIRDTFKDNSCHDINYQKNYNTLVKLIKEAEKVFVMDAYLHTWTVDWLQMVDKEADPINDFNIIMRHEKDDLIKKNVFMYNHFMVWFYSIVDDLKKGKKIYVFYPFASGNEKQKKKDIMTFMKHLLDLAGLKEKQGLAYFGKLDSDEKRKLSRVNDTWSVTQECLDRMKKENVDTYPIESDADFIKLVVVNTCVTVGVNYDETTKTVIVDGNSKEIDFRFDKVYLCSADFLSARQCVQSSMRPRHTKTPVIGLYYIPNFEKLKAMKEGKTYKPKPHMRASLVGNDPDHFTYLQDTIELEINSNGLDLLLHFMKTTGYKILSSSKNSDKLLGQQYRNTYKKYCKSRTDINCFDWDQIKAIDYNEFTSLDRKVRAQQSSLWENLQVDKFNVMRHFTDEYKDACSVFWKKEDILQSINILIYDNNVYRRRLALANGGYEEDRIMAKDREIRLKKNIFEKAVVYNKDDREFQIKTDKLSETDKMEIYQSFVLPEIEKDFNYFKQKSDLILRKRIIVAMFGKNALDNDVRHTKKLVFNEDFSTEYFDTAVNGLAELNPTEKASFLDGVCHIKFDEEDEVEEEEVVKIKEKKQMTVIDHMTKKNYVVEAVKDYHKVFKAVREDMYSLPVAYAEPVVIADDTVPIIEIDEEQKQFLSWIDSHKILVDNMLSGLVNWKEHRPEWVHGERFEEYRERKKKE